MKTRTKRVAATQVDATQVQAILDTFLDQGLHLAKLDTNPPKYKFALDGKEEPAIVTLSQFHSRTATNNIMFGQWDFHPLDLVSDGEWQEVIRLWFDSGKAGIINMPTSDRTMAILQSIYQYIMGRNLKARDDEQEYEDFIGGAFVVAMNKRPNSDEESEECYCFPRDQMYRFRHWLQNDFRYPVSDDEIGYSLTKVGMRIGRDASSIWVRDRNKPDTDSKVYKKVRCLAIPVEKLMTAVGTAAEEEKVEEPEHETLPMEF